MGDGKAQKSQVKRQMVVSNRDPGFLIMPPSSKMFIASYICQFINDEVFG
jgi:hypothetical protein